MAFDFQQLMDDPQAQFGIGLLGASSPRLSPLGQAFQFMQQAQRQQQQQAVQQAQLELQKQQAQAYQQQVETARARQAVLERSYADIAPLIKQSFGAAQPEPQPPAQQPFSTLQAAPPTLAANFLRSAITPQESGGNQWTPQGMPLLGPPIPDRKERAVGRNQILPSTGPEAAKLAGLEWNSALFNRQKTDIPELDQETTDYHDKLGEAYLDAQMQKFGGDTAKAAAAYQAGPGRVQKAIETAEQMKRPDLWLTLLPASTQEYATKAANIMAQQTGQQAQAAAPITPPSGPLGIVNQPALPRLPSDRGLALQQAAALAGAAKGDYGALGKLGEALAPKTYKRGDIIGGAGQVPVQLPDPLGERRVTVEEARAKADIDKEKRLSTVAAQEIKAAKSKDVAAFDMVSTSANAMEEQATKLLANPGLNRIVGATGGLISPRLLGGDARNAAAALENLRDKVMNDTLQSIRQASATGASGYGALDKAEGETLKNMIATLDRAQTPKAIRESIQAIANHGRAIRMRAQGVYESTYNESAFPGLPQGTQYMKTVNGKKVYKLPDGSMVREQ